MTRVKLLILGGLAVSGMLLTRPSVQLELLYRVGNVMYLLRDTRECLVVYDNTTDRYARS